MYGKDRKFQTSQDSERDDKDEQRRVDKADVRSTKHRRALFTHRKH